MTPCSPLALMPRQRGFMPSVASKAWPGKHWSDSTVIDRSALSVILFNRYSLSSLLVLRRQYSTVHISDCHSTTTHPTHRTEAPGGQHEGWVDWTTACEFIDH